jgi:hypothetical protein
MVISISKIIGLHPCYIYGVWGFGVSLKKGPFHIYIELGQTLSSMLLELTYFGESRKHQSLYE